MLKKNILVCVFFILFTIFSIQTVFANNTYLWKATDTTYVRSTHPGGYWSDVYYGTVSVRGSDRVRRNGKIYRYDWTKITYNVQGEIHREIAIRDYLNDYRQVVNNITVRDKWNFGDPTTVKYDYSEVEVPIKASIYMKVDQLNTVFGHMPSVIHGGYGFDVSNNGNAEVLVEGKDIFSEELIYEAR